MIPDSTNVRVMADNIRKLKTEVENAVELPSVETTDEGKVLTVNSSGKWAALDLPPYPVGNLDYSTNEQNTGVKWIDGKDIFFKTFTGITGDSTGTYTIGTLFDFDTIIDMLGTYVVSDGAIYNLQNIAIRINSSGNINLTLVTASLNSPFRAIIYYTKTDPVPGNREPDSIPEEPETKKSTKRKTTKGEN